ncbi:hypothetical protein [Leclercia sp.]|uniref:hypothetical protein n=1 Tax=Leclercia sp. TaxID=1898428 RepID=UPI00289B7E8D|nr:hypothetical protein [Leclercia sp.]
MILIDPYIFLPTKGTGYNVEKVMKIKNSLKNLLNINHRCKHDIVVDINQWRLIEKKYIRNLTQSFSDNELNTALISLRNIIKKVDFTSSDSIRTWGVKPLFNNFLSDEDKEFGDSFALFATYCIQQYRQAFLFVDESLGRNITEHASVNSKLIERLRWRVYISCVGLSGAVPVTCITSIRNLDIPWTTRYDYFLPDTGAYAFEPPVKWYLRSTDAVSTKKSKPVFMDSHGNGWANPNTPGQAYHWDVYLSYSKWINDRGEDQINITRYGAPQSQGVPGTIHHVPTKKNGLAKRK